MIEFDEDWKKIMLQKTEKNYFSLFLPEIFEKRMLKHLDPIEICVKSVVNNTSNTVIKESASHFLSPALSIL